jgi:hypothetical protein
LPGALSAVTNYFDLHPEVDVVFGDCVVADAKGNFLNYRKVQLPRKYHSMVCHLPIFTCSTFFRSKIVDQGGFLFDPKWRALGDVVWVLSLLEARVSMGVLRRFTSVYTVTGNNMSTKPDALRERRIMFEAAPWWARRFVSALKWRHRFLLALGGIYFQKPFDFALYTNESLDRRVVRHAAAPTFAWKNLA